MMLPCRSGAKSVCGSPLSDKMGSPDSRAGGGEFGVGCSDGPLLALLLNTGTQDEGEEFLDYCHPVEDQNLQAVLNMKGVFLASCGVMKAAVGQSLTLFVFWSADRSRQYKAAIQQIEQWILVVVLPGSVTDGVARFFVEEAQGLMVLRHGRLGTLRGRFRQLDPIFRSLSSLWQSLRGCVDEGEHREACVSTSSAAMLYALFGAVPWSSFTQSWQQRVGDRVTDWEAKVYETASANLLALPEGFALFLDHLLIGTNLDDALFKVCLHLCLLEGELSPELASSCGAQDVRCHSLFLSRDGTDTGAGSMLLPSHQYSVLRRGPWLLFVLWRMLSPEDRAAAAATPMAAAPGRPPSGSPSASPSTAVFGGDDPFGTDLCLDLLSGLPLPDEYVAKLAAQAALAMEAKGSRGGSSKSSGTGPRDLKRSFSLPCPGVLKPLVSRSSSGNNLKKLEPQPVRQSRFLHAMELQTPMSESQLMSSTPASPASPGSSLFASMRRPRLAASDRWPELLMPARCPEAASRCAAEAGSEWMTTHPSTLLLPEWSELEWLALDHSRRRSTWSAAPSQSKTRHPIMSVLKGAHSFNTLWGDCLRENERAMKPADGEAAGGSGQSNAQGAQKREGPTLLGSGEPWRFQAGAPFQMADLSPLLGAGVLKSETTGARSWAAFATLGRGSSSKPLHRVLLHLGLGSEVSAAASTAPSPAKRGGGPGASPGGRFQPGASPEASPAVARPPTFSPPARPPLIKPKSNFTKGHA
mmetsp:Transcript_4647/g.17477  ORF Transcript_4647/g.17477 Transcript_4647/m.17477 type:complete len:754 (+) Transcript_4647:71-2332(+)